jgi:MSHA biogenesis protein MshO
MRQKGVTLLELIIVLVILGAVSVGIATFVRSSVDSVVLISQREQLLSTSRFALERLRKEIERAIPNSIRVNKQAGEHCLQFVPFNWVSAYLDLPVAQSADYAASLPIIGPQQIDGTPYQITPNSELAIVYPLQPDEIYDVASMSNQLRKVRNVTACPSADCTTYTGNVLNLTLENGFPESSPAERVYFASEAVNFCVVNNTLVRFSSAIASTQPDSSSGSDTIANNIVNTLLAGSNTISSEDDPFQVFDASRLRNATVQIRLRFLVNNEQVTFQQEVHIPNAP